MIEPSRRALLGAAGLAAVGAAAGCAPQKAALPTGVSATGARQAGIARPTLPQSHLISVVLDLAAAPREVLASLGSLVVATTTESLDGGVDPGDLTVTVGVGPRVVAELDPDLPGADPLPTFSREDIAHRCDSGDLWLQICGSDALAVALAEQKLLAGLVGAAEVRWRQAGFRGSYESAGGGRQAGRNLFGFQDGIVNPGTRKELDDGVWINDPAALAGATIAVLRRFRFDFERWHRLDPGEKNAAVGRDLHSSEPLSGGGVAADPNLDLKTPDGRYKIPADAHIRRSHALAVGVPLMLRRGYSVADPEPGLLFVSFQNTLRAFTATMERLEQSDRLLEFATTTATGTFLVLPGFGPSRPLGSTVFA